MGKPKPTAHYREIEVLRRIVFELSVIELETLRAQFENDDPECIDYIDWLIRRREIL